MVWRNKDNKSETKCYGMDAGSLIEIKRSHSSNIIRNKKKRNDKKNSFAISNAT